MPQRVVLELHGIPEFSWTSVAGIKRLFFMSFLVLQQMKVSAETLVTDVTHKNLFGFLDFWGVLIIVFFSLCSICNGIKNNNVSFTGNNVSWWTLKDTYRDHVRSAPEEQLLIPLLLLYPDFSPISQTASR